VRTGHCGGAHHDAQTGANGKTLGICWGQTMPERGDPLDPIETHISRIYWIASIARALFDKLIKEPLAAWHVDTLRILAASVFGLCFALPSQTAHSSPAALSRSPAAPLAADGRPIRFHLCGTVLATPASPARLRGFPFLPPVRVLNEWHQTAMGPDFFHVEAANQRLN